MRVEARKNKSLNERENAVNLRTVKHPVKMYFQRNIKAEKDL